MNAPDVTPTRFMIFHDLDSLSSGSITRAWPAHITVVPWFHIDPPGLPETLQAIAETTADFGSIPASPGSHWLFNNPVTEILDPSGRLHELQNNLIARLGSIGCRFEDLRYFGAAYTPHSSRKMRADPPPRTEDFTIGSVSIVTRTLPQTVYDKHIYHVFGLGKPAA